MIPNIIRRRLFVLQNHHLHNCFNSEKKHFSNTTGREEDTENITRSHSKQTLRSLLDSSATFVETHPENDEDRWATLPYVEGTMLSKRNRQDLDIERPKIDPRDTSIILFPGQGSQFVGMARTLEKTPVARDLFDYASEILGYNLLELCNKGPRYRLNDIRYGHVAIMTASLANLELLREERPHAVDNCVGSAGFSLGEITALVFAGALKFDQALQLVQLRAEAIHAAGEIHKGGMATIRFGPDSRVIDACKQAKEWCRKNNIENPECLISNFMFPRFKALSGNEEALQYIEENLNKFRIRSLKRVKNTPACHSSLMEPAIEPFKKALKHIDIADPIIRVYSNVNSKPYMSAEHILKLLPQQLVKPVKWEQTMTNLYARGRGNYFPRTIVCGPGCALNSILKEVNLRAWKQSIHIGDKNK